MANTLYQQYRPKSWSDLVGQDKAVAVARRIVERQGFDRGAFFIDCAGGFHRALHRRLVTAQFQRGSCMRALLPGWDPLERGHALVQLMRRGVSRFWKSAGI